MHAPYISPKLATFSTAYNASPPRDLGKRYSEDGEFLPEPGNTVVCHFIEGSKTQNAIIKARQRLIDMPEATTHLAFTPISSLHMTVFQGIIEYRRKWPYWPKEMSESSSIAEMTSFYLDRLHGFPKLPAFEMQVTSVTPYGLGMTGATPEDNRVVAEWRDAFADAFGYRHPNHEIYEFHITFAYGRRWFEPECLPAWQLMLDDCLRELRSEAPVIEMRPPAFCEFRDMNHFEELIVFEAL